MGFVENDEIKERRKDLANLPSPSAYSNTYANQVKDIYGKVSNRGSYKYDRNNDEAYKQYAANYRALQGLAMANNQQQAQDLTGGYGSTYAPYVADQGSMNADASLSSIQPAYAMADQKIWMGQNEALANKYGAAAQMRDNEFKNYQDQYNAYSDAFKTKAGMLNDAYNNAYNIYKDDEEYRLKEQANQYNYDLDVMRQNKSSRRGGSGGRRGGKRGSTGKYDNDKPQQPKKSASTYGFTPEQILKLGYGPISDKRLDELVDNGQVAVYKDDNGTLQVARTEPKKSGFNNKLYWGR